MSQDYRYPSSAQVSVSAIGPNGGPIPTTSILVAGNAPGNILTPISVDSAGVVNVNAVSLSPITGTVTANQGTPNSLANRWPVELTDGTLTNTFSANGLLVDGSTVTQPISAASLPLPTGASTSANQATEIASLASILANQTNGTQVTQITGTVPVSGTVTANQGTSPWVDNISQFGGAAVTLGQTVSASSMPVVIASDQSAIPITAASLPLPTGAATSANQTDVQSAPGSSASTAVTVQGNASGIALPISATALPLPTGAATSANQTNGTQETQIVQGGNTAVVKAASTPAAAADPALVVAISPNNPITTNQGGRAKANAPTYTDYSSTPVTSGAYVQVIASTSLTANLIEIFDSSGVPLKLAVGGVGSEVDQLIDYPGGNGQVSLNIPAGSRISLKAVTTSATSGFQVINLYT